MARLIVKSPYIKCGGGQSAGGYLKYIATRERVEIIPDDRPPTNKQTQLIAKLVKDFPDAKELMEYEDYLSHPTKATASALITLALESNWDRVQGMEGYAKYIALRPRAERLGEHGLFGDDDAVDLAAVADELDHYTGNVWTHIISLHREDAERLGYDHADTWRTLLRTHRNDIAAAMKIPPEDFRWYAAFHDEGNHPHVHMMAWSVKPNQAYLSKDGIRQINWYETHSKPTLRASTQNNYENVIHNHVLPEIGKIPLNKLSQNDLQQFYGRLKKNGRKRLTEQYGAGLSDRMVRMCHAVCRSALERAVRDDLLRTNPAIGCKLPPKKAKEMQVLDREELQKFLIQAQADGYYELFLLDLCTGLRRGELIALQWDDLNFETGVLTVNKQAYTVNGELQIIPPKTKASVRKLVLPPAVRAVLREYHKKVDSRWMFPSPVKADRPITPGVARRRLQTILERADCKRVRFHDLRHTFATLALENGMNVKTLSAMLGHVSAVTTLDIYTHITGDMQRAAAACIDRSIGKAEPQKEAEPKQKGIVDFQPYVGKKRKPGTGCVSELNDHLFEGRYSPIWPDGTQHSRNVYARTREECEEKLKELITEMNEERKNLKEQLAGIAPPEKLTKKQRKLWDYMRLHPEVTEFSTIAKRTGLARNTVKKHYGMVAAMLGRK